MKQKNKSLNSFIFDTNLYHRLVRYPMFPITPKVECTQKVRNGYAFMKSKEKVSVEDAEKLFAIIYMTQKNSTPFEILNSEKFNEEVVFIKFKLKTIRDILNNNDDENIIKSIEILTDLTLTFILTNYEKKKGDKGNYKLVTHPILMSKLDKETKEMTILMEKFFFEVCLEKALSINLNSFLQLKGLAKNLYLFLSANMDKTNFLYETIRERCHIEPQIPNFKFRQNLKKALTDIQKTGLVKSFTITKNSIEVSFSKTQIPSDKITNAE